MRRFSLSFVLVGLLSCGDSQVVVREMESTCGNGDVELSESCDDGNDENGDGCTNAFPAWAPPG